MRARRRRMQGEVVDGKVGMGGGYERTAGGLVYEGGAKALAAIRIG